MGNKFKAFTLAEVLITLGIIGIVAALTIPPPPKNSSYSNITACYNAFEKNFIKIVSRRDQGSNTNCNI